MTTQISSDELHMLIFRFLQESGFEHSAYVFAMESMLTSSSAATTDVPCGALISFLHKGLLFAQLEREVEEPKRIRLTHTGEDTTSTSEQPDGSSQVLVLKGHQKEVFACSFSSTEGNVLASGSGDSFARIWKVQADGQVDCRLLEHEVSTNVVPVTDANNVQNAEKTEQTSGLTTLTWNPVGDTLATGSLDGRVRLWGEDGSYKASLIHHKGAVYSVKWSSKGKMLLTGGHDKTAVVWDASKNAMIRSFEVHKLQVLDVDWRPKSGSSSEDDDDIFASCSSDKTVVIYSLSTGETVTLDAHKDEINVVAWSPDGKLLASCSDDATAKIWTVASDIKQSTPTALELRGHTKEVYSIKWSPTGPGSANPKLPRRVATASFDHTVGIWDPETGTLLHSLAKHNDVVYAIDFDPSGEHLLSGSFNGLVNAWNVETGALVKSVKVGGGVFEVSWNIRGDKFAVASSDGTITVVDF